MINHARTLLLNIRSGDIDEVGEEYIHESFHPTDTLPGYMAELRKILFGMKPDRRLYNFRARQYMAILHSTELFQYVLQLDTRITYDVANDDLFMPSLWGITQNYEDLFLTGELPPPDVTGQSHHRWNVEVLDGDTAHVRRIMPAPLRDELISFSVVGELSSEITLPGSSIKIRVRPETGAEWILSGYSRPRASLGSILASLESVGESAITQLLGVGMSFGGNEPFLTFTNLWRDHHELPYRLGAILISLIYRLDSIRKGHG